MLCLLFIMFIVLVFSGWVVIGMVCSGLIVIFVVFVVFFMEGVVMNV